MSHTRSVALSALVGTGMAMLLACSTVAPSPSVVGPAPSAVGSSPSAGPGGTGSVILGDTIEIPLPDAARDVAVTAQDVWISHASGAITVVAASGSITGQVDLEPGLDSLEFDTASVWVINGLNQVLSQIDAGSHAVIGSYPLPGGRPVYLAVGRDKLWVTAELDESIAIVDKTDGTVVSHFKPSADPESVAFDGTRYWVGSFYGDRVTVFDDSGQELASLSADRRIFALDSDGAYMWAASYDAQVVYRFALDGYERAAFPVAGYPYDIVTARGVAWVTVNRDCATGAPPTCVRGALLALDAASGDVRLEVDAPPSSNIAFGLGAIWLTSERSATLGRIGVP